jgi:hypothetical protein
VSWLSTRTTQGPLLYMFGSYLLKGIHPKSEKNRVFIT